MNLPEALLIEPLEAARFARFGDVIEAAQARAVFHINTGTALRFHDLARIDTAQRGGRTVLSLFRAQPRRFPLAVEVVERHPLGSQAFSPLSGEPYLVVVSESPSHRPRAFAARADQGVNFPTSTPAGDTRSLKRKLMAITTSSTVANGRTFVMSAPLLPPPFSPPLSSSSSSLPSGS